jgi:hypothetical protein
MFFKPRSIPGTGIRPKDKPGSKLCPNCRRYYSAAIPKRTGKKKKKVSLHCPFCDKEV